VSFTLPSINSAQDAAAVVSSVLAAVAAGEITPRDAAEVGELIDSYVKAYETVAAEAEASMNAASLSANCRRRKDCRRAE
jgi:hypothetical protein